MFTPTLHRRRLWHLSSRLAALSHLPSSSALGPLTILAGSQGFNASWSV